MSSYPPFTCWLILNGLFVTALFLRGRRPVTSGRGATVHRSGRPTSENIRIAIVPFR